MNPLNNENGLLFTKKAFLLHLACGSRLAPSLLITGMSPRAKCLLARLQESTDSMTNLILRVETFKNLRFEENQRKSELISVSFFIWPQPFK